MLNQNTGFFTEMPDIPMYNFFTHIHGIENQSVQFDGDLSDHMFSSPILEFNGYIAVVHEPTYTDMGNFVHFNPSPVFIPEAGTISLFILSAILFKIRIK